MYKVLSKSINKHLKADAIYYMNSNYSFADLDLKIARIEQSFLFIGIEENDIVCIALPNIPQTVFCVYALNKIGAKVCMIHPLASEKEINTCISKTKPKALIIIDTLTDATNQIKSNTLEKIIITNATDELPIHKRTATNLPFAENKATATKKKLISYMNFIDLGENNNIKNNYIENADNIALILSSGGTTGKPKYVCLTNKSIDVCVEQICGQVSGSVGHKMLTVMPMFHGNGAVTGVHFPLTIGMSCVLIPRFSTKIYAENLINYKGNMLSGTPGLFERLIKEPIMQKADLSHLIGVFSGADFLSEDTENKINDFLIEHNSKVTVRQAYGLTEGVAISTLVPDGVIKHGSIGVPFKGVHLKIVKPNTENELPVGEIGEIVFSSETNMKKYLNDEKETKNILRRHSDGLIYIHSGDLGCIDNEGFVYFKGRIKRMIVTNGYNIFPVEIENIIESHPQVSKCCVLGLPDNKRGEKVVAYIQPTSNSINRTKLDLSIKAFVKKNIAKYSIPKEYHYVKEMPLTKIGKINYQQLLKTDK